MTGGRLQKIGPYRVLALLGKGGMGEVYRAKDSKLDREVAIKVLPEAFLADPDRLARLHREARVLASLNHPNIATIHSLEESGASCSLVMELVSGLTLAERLAGGAVPVEESLRIGRQVADALAAAHQQGITHRDIKPANIKLTPHGIVKVLDFGLAKVASVDAVSGETPTVNATQQGVVVGTTAYMSPEQARAGPVDKRTDVWAFGCVLYELLTGRAAFRRETTSATIAAILERDPDWTALPDATPANIRQLLRRCLEKDAGRRLHDVTDARIEIEHALQSPSGVRPLIHQGDVRSLAVLPFANASGDPEMEYLSDGLSETISLSLSQLPQLRVMSRSAVFRYKGRSDEALTIGRTLGVQAVLTGKVFQRGETLAISAELVEVESGWQLWGAQYRRKANDLFAIEEDIASEISAKLRLRLTPEQPTVVPRRYTDDVAAYHLYLKGRFYCGKRTEEGLRQGIQFFRQAIEVDPTYALAYMGLSWAYAPLAFYCHMAPNDAVPKLRAAAEHALDIDPGLIGAQTALAGYRGLYEWNLDQAERELRAILDQEPNSPSARQVLAEVLTITRRFTEALQEAARALDSDPLALNLNAFMAMMYYFDRQYDQAIERSSRTIEMDPTFFPGYLWLGMACQQLGRLAEAAAAVEKAQVLSNNSTLTTACLGAVLAQMGREQDARRILGQLDETPRRRYVSRAFVAAIHAALGEAEPALTALEQSYDDRCCWLLYGLAADPRLDNLRGEVRFQNLARRVGVAL